MDLVLLIVGDDAMAVEVPVTIFYDLVWRSSIM